MTTDFKQRVLMVTLSDPDTEARVMSCLMGVVNDVSDERISWVEGSEVANLIDKSARPYRVGFVRYGNGPSQVEDYRVDAYTAADALTQAELSLKHYGSVAIVSVRPFA